MPGSILLAGATGLVGNRVLRRLLDWPGATGTVVAPVRRPLTLVHPRLRAPVLDFALGEEDFAQALEAAGPGQSSSRRSTRLPTSPVAPASRIEPGITPTR